MIFYVYMDPGVISVAKEEGAYATQALIGILRGFLQNCFIAEFEDHRVQAAIKEQIDNFPANYERKIIKSVLSTLKKRNRFIYCLVPDYSGEKDDLACLCEQAVDTLLDLLLLREMRDNPSNSFPVQVTTLATYQNTGFEAQRSRLAGQGLTLRNGELGETDFLNRCFLKAMRFAASIEICDKLFGSKFGDNFEYTAKKLLQWLADILVDPRNCRLVFHCGKPAAGRDDYMKTELVGFKPSKLSAMPMELQFYDLPNPDTCLPHHRFIVTDQVALSIDRGMDFLNKATQQNRDVSVDYKNRDEVDRLLQDYARGKV